MSNVRLGSEVRWLHVTTVASGTEEHLAATEGLVRDSGEWGEIVDVERDYKELQVLGLLGPDAADATATADFTFELKGQAGLKLKLGIATLGVSATYTVDEGIHLDATPGAAVAASFLLPVDVVTQMYRPDGAAEWFQRQRYQLVMFDPVAPNVGARADIVPIDTLLSRRQLPGTRVGGGSAPISQDVSTTTELDITAEFEIPLSAEEKGPSLTLSASLSGSVKIDVAYKLPANVGFQQYWLAPIAGACFVKG